jgi:hypothetical protein
MTERRFWIVMAALSGAVGAGVAVCVRSAERPPTVEVAVAAPPRERAAVPDVAQVLRASKLITVEVRTGVDASSQDASWRGDVRASVRAPVTLYYGVDLSDLSPERVWRSPLTGGYVIRVPAPRRLAVEVIGDDAVPDVRVSGLRLRDVAGEYHLGLARGRLYDAARRIELGPIERAGLERTTREQVARIVRAIAGRDVPVEVVFGPAEETAPGGAAAQAGGVP